MAKKGAAKTPKSIFGEILYRHRHKKGWSQEVLASHCHLSRDFISKLENGHRMPSVKTIAKIAPHFHFTAEALYLEFLTKMRDEGLYDKWLRSRGQ